MQRRLAGAGAGAAALLVWAFLGASLDFSARADMYHPLGLHAGGVDPHPWITSLSKDGTNATLSWYGLEGPYHVQMTPSLSPPQWTNAADTLASDYAWGAGLTGLQGSQSFFRLNPDNSYMGASACSGCHSTEYGNWQRTGHAHALSLVTNLPPATMQRCLPCHTTGNGEPGGFVSLSTTPNLADVGCETCHGPAAAHKYGDKNLVRPAFTLASEVCGGCHSGAHYPTYSEWTNSAHVAVTPDVASGFADTPSGQNRMMSCGPCHSGAARLAMLDNYQDMLRGYTNAVVLPSANDAMAFAQTCAVCHDPHATNGGPCQLRNPVASTNFYTFFNGSATNQYGQYMNTVFATQYVAGVQICAQCHNSRGASWTSSSRPPHHSPQYNMLLGTVGELASGLAPNQPASHGLLITNQCAGCHMQSSPYVSEQQPAVTGHSFKVESFNICADCHSDPEGLFEFATNSVATQIQQVKAALDYWATTKAPPALQAKYGARAWEYTNPGELSPGGPGPDSTEQALLPVNIRKARYNLYLVLHDGSYGIHNPRFAVTLLNTAYDWVQQEVNQ